MCSPGERLGEQLQAASRGRPDAVFCANDLLAIGVLQALTLMGDVGCPDDIALIGYDDIDFARVGGGPLTSIRQPSMQIGTAAVDLLAAAADVDHAPQHIVYQPELDHPGIHGHCRMSATSTGEEVDESERCAVAEAESRISCASAAADSLRGNSASS